MDDRPHRPNIFSPLRHTYAVTPASLPDDARDPLTFCFRQLFAPSGCAMSFRSVFGLVVEQRRSSRVANTVRVIDGFVRHRG
jgi:hypothetical protein